MLVCMHVCLLSLDRRCNVLSHAHVLLTFAITLVGLPELTCVICNQTLLLHAYTTSCACLLRAEVRPVAFAVALMLFALCLCMLAAAVLLIPACMHVCAADTCVATAAQQQGTQQGAQAQSAARLVRCERFTGKPQQQFSAYPAATSTSGRKHFYV